MYRSSRIFVQRGLPFGLRGLHILSIFVTLLSTGEYEKAHRKGFLNNTIPLTSLLACFMFIL
jgi:hypothetical protein